MDFSKYGNCIEGRLYAIRKNENMNQEKFGKKIGVTRSAICNYENGTRPIGEQVILAVCREFGVNELWLRDGIGEPYAHVDGGILEHFIVDYNCSEFEANFLRAYFQLSGAEREQFCRYIELVFKPAFEAARKTTLKPTLDAEALHAELDRQISMEKGATEKSGAS